MSGNPGPRRVSLLAIALVLACLVAGACGGDGGSEAGGDVDLSELEAKLVEMQEAKSPNLTVEMLVKDKEGTVVVDN